jgi:hypothetical protein
MRLFVLDTDHVTLYYHGAARKAVYGSGCGL